MVAKTQTQSRARSMTPTRHASLRRHAVPSPYEYYLDLLARHAAPRRR